MNATQMAARGRARSTVGRRFALSAILALACAALLAIAAGPAAAHVHVEPTVAPPDDGVDFTFLVPGERDGVPTTEIEVAIPDGVSPYSVEDPAGWTHRLLGREGSPQRVVWKGRLAPDGFAEFGLLASTPAQEGTLTWKVLQTYGNGEVVRWIGPPDSENPAPVTEVSADAAATDAAEAHGAAPAETEASGADAGGDDNWARVIAIVALALAIASLALWRRSASESDSR